jgi:hypothetical protein
MTDRATLIALAERCEQAAGPDRELDFAIAAGVGWPDSPNLHQHARRYTESLDAAVTLVPQGCGWMIMGNAAKVGRLPSRGATSPLALCAAALRARAIKKSLQVHLSRIA